MSNMSLQMDYDDHRLLWDGICNHTINSMYAALTLYIIGTDDWKRDFKGRNPKYFHAHIKDWLCKYSQYASVLYNSYDPIVRKKYLKIKQGNVVPSDILRNFISLSFNKKFFINKFDFYDFVISFKKIIEALSQNHREWANNYLERLNNEHYIEIMEGLRTSSARSRRDKLDQLIKKDLNEEFDADPDFSIGSLAPPGPCKK